MAPFRRFIALLPILLLTACGGTGPTAPGSTPGPTSQQPASTPGTGTGSAASPGAAGAACALLTDGEVAELTSLEIETKEAQSAGGIYSNGCHWVLADGGVVKVEIILGMLTEGGRAHFDTVLVPLAEGLGGKPLAGVGDDALVGADGKGVTAVVDDMLVDLQWIDASSDTTGVPVALMKLALANLAGG
ncbi:MAG TPA: DUF3558 family protein [Candidatus Limnocylindrales bacterium]|nr:DUF3558 family protein [Candidatus Limnocylindrales bacterium]